MQTAVRVRSLTYREKWLSPGISLNSPRPAFRIGDFDAAFEKGLWNFTALTDFASVESARATLEPLLQDWETEWDVLEQLRLCFEFKSCVLEEARSGNQLHHGRITACKNEGSATAVRVGHRRHALSSRRSPTEAS